jgi:environmental stress-induced protein Ves
MLASMAWTLVPVAAARPQPSGNGAGVMRELLAWPQAEACRVRMVLAEVQRSGPLPRFPGGERWFAGLEGDGVVLRMPRARQRATRSAEPLRFDAGMAVDSRLVRGPSRHFSVVAAPGQAAMCRVQGTLAFATGEPTLLAVYAHGAPAQVRPGGAPVLVPPYHLGWNLQEQPVSGMVAGEDALWIEATP